MKKLSSFLLVVISVFTLFVSACSDDNNNPTNQGVGQDPQQMEADKVYLALGNSSYSDPAGFYVSAADPNFVHSTLSPATQIISAQFDPINEDFVKFKFIAPGTDTCYLDARKTPFKYSELPIQSPSAPYDGLGVVQERNLVWRYEQSTGFIKIFEMGGTLRTESATTLNDTVFIANNRRLEPHQFNPDPAIANLHYWFDGWLHRAVSFKPFMNQSRFSYKQK